MIASGLGRRLCFVIKGKGQVPLDKVQYRLRLKFHPSSCDHVRKNELELNLAATEIEAKHWLATPYSLEPWMTSPAFFAPKH
jgi:hypothetical protein